MTVSTLFGKNSNDPSHAQVWLSSDGRSWERATKLPMPPNTRLQVVASDESGALMAVGWIDHCPVGDPCALGEGEGLNVWTSTDGVAWTHLPQDSNVKSAIFRMLVHGPRGWVAGGDVASNAISESPAGTVWTSTDGLTWTEVFRDSSTLSLTAIASGHDGVAILASRFDDQQSRETFALTSPDGTTWSQHLVVSDPDIYFQGLSALPSGGWVLAGSHFLEHATDGYCLRAVAAVYTSQDGIGWTEVPPQASLGLAGVQAVAVTGHGLVAIGSTCFGDWSWWSPDGQTWSASPVFPPAKTVNGAKISGFGNLVAGSIGVVAYRQNALDLKTDGLFASVPGLEGRITDH